MNGKEKMKDITLRHIYKAFGENQVLNDYSVTIKGGRLNVLMGPSGCGKTTLLHIIAGLEEYQSGDLSELDGLRISVAFQEPRLLRNLSVEGNIAFVLSRREREELLEQIMVDAALTPYRHKKPDQLSGGYQQRVNLARALAVPAGLYLLDEPFSSTDAAGRQVLFSFMEKRRREENGTVLMVTHHLEELPALALNIIRME